MRRQGLSRSVDTFCSRDISLTVSNLVVLLTICSFSSSIRFVSWPAGFTKIFTKSSQTFTKRGLFVHINAHHCPSFSQNDNRKTDPREPERRISAPSSIVFRLPNRALPVIPRFPRRSPAPFLSLVCICVSACVVLVLSKHKVPKNAPKCPKCAVGHFSL